MRKVIFGSLACILIFSLILVGCGSGSSSPAATTAKPPAATTAAPATSAAPAPATSAAPAPASSAAPQPSASAPASPAAASTDYPIPFNPNAQKGGTMIFNHNQVISFISAPADGPQISQRAARAVFEPLLVCDAQETIKPWLATSFTVSPDGKAVTFKLRQGVKFTDGTDFNADAVKFNMDLDLKANITGSSVLKNVTSYTIPDPYTITFNLAKPDVLLLLGLAQQPIGLIASPTAQQKPTTPDTITQVHCVGTGPFVFDSWQRDSFIQFKANPNYWQKGKPYLDVLRWNFVPDFTASLLAFRSGQANVVLTLDPIDAVGLKKDNFNVGFVTLKMMHYLVPDGGNPDSPFAKLEVRQALEYAINKDELSAVGMGYFFPTTQMAASTDAYYDSTITPRKFDLAKAKQLLTSAGYPNGVPTLVVTNQSIRVDTENLILAQLKAGGFNVTKVDTQPSAAYTTTTQKGWKSGTPGTASLLMPGFPNPGNFSSLNGRFNTTMYPDEYHPAGWVDSWSTAVAQPDSTKSYAMVKTLIRQIFDTAMMFPYQYDSSRFVYDNKANGWAEYYYANNAPDFYQPAELWMKTK